VTRRGDATPIRAVIFDLDGVIVSTDELHYAAWKEIADELGIEFDHEKNKRLRGVGRMESLEILLGERVGEFTTAEKEALATRKNEHYRSSLETLSPAEVLPGALPLLEALRGRGIRLAIGSSSRNTPTIIERIGLRDWFEVVADGNRVTHSKPDPEAFLLAAHELGVPAEECLVVEDADAGVEAALSGGMRVLAVGSAADHPGATYRSKSLREVDVDWLVGPAWSPGTRR
jgi:beta-phosphoglucomutase